MPNCYRCQHFMKGNPACLDCKDTEPSHAGKCFVYLGGIDDPDGYLEKHAAEDWRDSAGGETATGLPDGVEDYLRRLLSVFSQMTDREALLCKRLLAGKTATEIAKEYGITRQGIHANLNRVVRRFPEIRALAKGAQGRRGAGARFR